MPNPTISLQRLPDGLLAVTANLETWQRLGFFPGRRHQLTRGTVVTLHFSGPWVAGNRFETVVSAGAAGEVPDDPGTPDTGDSQ